MKRSFKFALLSLALAANLAPMLAAPAVKLLAVEFSDNSQVLIQLIVTFSSVFILPTLLLVSMLSRRFPKKAILIAGLVLYVIGGVGPAFANDVIWILVFHAILGLGIGLITPLQKSAIIAEHFEGKERSKMNGFISSVSGIGGAVFITIGGTIAAFGWRGVFFTYAYAVILLILVVLFIPMTPKADKDGKTQKMPMPFHVYAYGMASAGLLIVYYTVPTNLALFITDNNFGDTSAVGYITALSMIAIFIAGITVTPLIHLLKRALVPVMLVLFGLSYWLLSEASSLWMVALGVFVIGFGQGTIYPILFNKTAEVAPMQRMTGAMSLLFAFTFIGQFSSPLIMNGVQALFRFDSLRGTFLLIAIVMGIATVIFLFMMAKTKVAVTIAAHSRREQSK